MIINTCYHGEIEVQKKDIIFFSKGIPGFEREKEFVLLSISEEDVYFALQSMYEPNLAFIVTNPFLFFRDYEFKLEEAMKKALEVNESSGLEVYVVLTVAEPFEETTANLQGPILINKDKMLGKQVAVNNPTYRTKHLLPIPVKEEK